MSAVASWLAVCTPRLAWVEPGPCGPGAWLPPGHPPEAGAPDCLRHAPAPQLEPEAAALVAQLSLRMQALGVSVPSDPGMERPGK